MLSTADSLSRHPHRTPKGPVPVIVCIRGGDGGDHLVQGDPCRMAGWTSDRSLLEASQPQWAEEGAGTHTHATCRGFKSDGSHQRPEAGSVFPYGFVTFEVWDQRLLGGVLSTSHLFHSLIHLVKYSQKEKKNTFWMPLLPLNLPANRKTVIQLSPHLLSTYCIQGQMV